MANIGGAALVLASPSERRPGLLVCNTQCTGRRALPTPETKQQVLAIVCGWSQPIETIVQATPAEAIVRTDIADRPPLRRWSNGRITLLGDVAHPTTPDLGQGGCQALEAADALADALAGHSPERIYLILAKIRIAAAIRNLQEAERSLKLAQHRADAPLDAAA